METLKPIVSSKLLKLFKEVYDKTLLSIAIEYKLSPDQLLETYKLETSKIAFELGLKKRNRRILEDDKRCMGRKFDGEQCTRSKRKNSDYCLSHEKNLPQGRIDDTNFKPREKGKRGRKRKDHFFENDDNYLATTLEIIDNESYLIDSNKNVYTYCIENPKFIGILNEHNKIEIKLYSIS